MTADGYRRFPLGIPSATIVKMSTNPQSRIDSSSRIIKASRKRIYQAYVDPQSLVSWLPPQGMIARVDAFEPHEGGAYRIVLTLDGSDPSARGTASEHTDVVCGRFLKLVPNEQIVQSVEFESDDSAFAGEMKMTWTLTEVPGGTEVAIRCENVPAGIRPEDHEAGFRSTLENLAMFVEGQPRTRGQRAGSEDVPR
jgi:uncharacterized protein YndB with AHSA1/START domain